MTGTNHKSNPFDPQQHRRRSIRLKGYDYTTPGAYFITICTYQRVCLFGEIVKENIILNDLGEIAFREWFKTGDLRENVELFPHEFVVMTNHIHGVIWLIETDPELKRTSFNSQNHVGARRSVDNQNNVGARRSAVENQNITGERFVKPVSGSIPTIVRSYKAAVTYRINKLMKSPRSPNLAAQLFHPHHPQSTGTARHPGIHPRKPH